MAAVPPVPGEEAFGLDATRLRHTHCGHDREYDHPSNLYNGAVARSCATTAYDLISVLVLYSLTLSFHVIHPVCTTSSQDTTPFKQRCSLMGRIIRADTVPVWEA
jgi:hypothetical protein